MARVGFDIDGVLYDFAGQFTKFVNDNSEFDFPYPQTWKFYEEWDKDQGWFDYWHAEFVKDGQYEYGQMIDQQTAVAALCELHYAGHTKIGRAHV